MRCLEEMHSRSEKHLLTSTGKKTTHSITFQYKQQDRYPLVEKLSGIVLNNPWAQRHLAAWSQHDILRGVEVKMADDRLHVCSVCMCVCVFSQVHSTWIWAECP